MKTLKLLVVLLVAPLLTLGCGGGGSSGGGGGGLIGTWRGTTSSTVQVYSSPITVTITSDDGVNFAGRAAIPNSPCFQSASFAGTRNGNSVGVGMINGPNVAGASLSLSGNTMSGSYAVTAGACRGDRGILSISR